LGGFAEFYLLVSNIVDVLEMELTVASTTLCLLHRAHMPPAMSTNTDNPTDDNHYPSRIIAFRAAHGITSIVDNLVEHDQLKYCPAFM
jgi:hypothetical protein